MTRHAVLISVVLPWLAAAPAVAQTSPACKPLFDAMTKVATTPHHSTSTTSNSTAVGEMITAAGANYVKIGGAWQKSRMTPQANVEQQQENIKAATSITCKQLPDDRVDGAVAVVYSLHSETPDLPAADSKTWISKATGLPLRSETDLGSDPKQHISVKYDYANITAPIVK